MFPRSTDYVVCEHIAGCDWRVIFKGSKRIAGPVCRIARSKHSGKKFCFAFSRDSELGDIVKFPAPVDCAGVVRSS